MEDNKTAMERAVDLFEQQKYRESLAVFSEVYDHSQDENEREVIRGILDEAFYAPNEEALRANYERNIEVLKQYPYFWGGTFRGYDDLTFRLFPASDEYFYRYGKKKDCFEGEYDAATDGQMRYFFENLDKPLFVENEDNLYNLNFLNDNVRASEDYAGDNHIYLFYDTSEPLERLMMTCDLGPVLQQKKFVFLVGEENKKHYPLDFQKEFGIDYDSMTPSPVRIEEIKRVCYWYKHARSGTEMSIAIIGSLNEVQKLSGFEFNTYSKIDGQRIVNVKEYKDAVTDNVFYTVEQISKRLRSGKYELRLEDINGFINWLRQHRPVPHAYTVKELFCGYSIFQYEKRNLNPRIAPLILYDPHMWDPGIYDNIMLSFPYHTVLTCVREPIMTFIRCQQVKIAGWDEPSTKLMLAHDYQQATYLHRDLLPYYYGFRFEDLKTKPEAACRALCKHLNVPYDKVMLDADAPDRMRTHKVKGCFDTAPLKWDLSASLSDFDKVRLQMFYNPILRHYGYPTFSFEEHPLPENLVRELFKYPFRFEYVNSEIYNNTIDQDTFHDWVQDVLQNLWRKESPLPKLIPIENLDDQEQETDQQGRQTNAHIGNRQQRRMNKRKK